MKTKSKKKKDTVEEMTIFLNGQWLKCYHKDFCDKDDIKHPIFGCLKIDK